MGKNEKNYHLGEIVTLPREETLLKKNGLQIYMRYTGSRYICIRQATDNQPGILVKVLGKLTPERIMMVNEEPFTKDDRAESFNGICYFSYPFPALTELKEILDIIRSNQSLLQIFEDASMHVNPKSKFWVNETASRLLVMKKPQCYDASTDDLCTASDHEAPYRLTMVYF